MDGQQMPAEVMQVNAGMGQPVQILEMQEPQSESQMRLASFWEQERQDIERMPVDPGSFKNSELPLARIKKIMKLDDDVKNMMISAEAPVLFAKAAEIFIRELTLRAWIHTERNKRRTLQRNDIAMSVGDQDTDQFDFLIDIVPREDIRPSQGHSSSSSAVTSSHNVVQQVQQPVMQSQQQPVQLHSHHMDNQMTPVSQSQQPVQYVIQLPVGATQPANGQTLQISFVNPSGGQDLSQLVQYDVKPDLSQVNAAMSAASQQHQTIVTTSHSGHQQHYVQDQKVMTTLAQAIHQDQQPQNIAVENL